jgi:hypothetical protein
MNFAPINGLRMLAIETGLLVIFTALAFTFWPRAAKLLTYTLWSHKILGGRKPVVLVIGLALLGRAALLPCVGVPHPRINDEFSYLLMGDTFAHFRLTNPTPADWEHFETFHVNFEPTYHSKYPLAQGLAVGFGEAVFRQPWVGIYLSTALLCGAICWALQAFMPAGWALLGALLATFRIALFSYWMNSYWGGSMAALGGALSLGAVVRLFQASQSERRRVFLAAVFAVSLLLLANSRPYEGFCFALPLVVYYAYKIVLGVLRREGTTRSTALPAVVIGLGGLVMMAHYNQRTTGNALLLPHLLNERTYSPLPLFLWQQPKSDFHFHDPVFAKFFEMTEGEYHYQQDRTASGLLSLEAGRLTSDWFFYIGVALSLPVLIGFLSCARQPQLHIVVVVALSTAIGLALCIYAMPHYAAPATVTIYIFATEGLRYLWEQGRRGERAFVVAVCLTVMVSSLARQTGSAALNQKYAFPDTRRLVADQLNQYAGKHLVLVSYDLNHHYPGDELVHNGADFGSEKILWARSKGSSDAQLCDVYADRKFWTVMTDDVSYALKPVDLCMTKGAARR